jgi:hypothetical protein
VGADQRRQTSHGLDPPSTANRLAASAAFEDEPAPPPGRSKDGMHTVENLGARNLFGLDTVGTRQITTIPRGTMGNDGPIQDGMRRAFLLEFVWPT